MSIYVLNEVIEQPYVDGVVCRIKWKDTEQFEEVYDFSVVTRTIQKAQAAGKKVTLSPLSSEPPFWVLNQVPADQVYLDEKSRYLIVPWNEIQMQAFLKFVTALATFKIDGIEIRNHPAISHINWTIPGTTSIRLSPVPSGYSYSLYEGCVIRALDHWQTLYTYSLNQLNFVGLFYFPGGYKNPSASEMIREKVISRYLGIAFFQEFLTGSTPIPYVQAGKILFEAKGARMFQACGPWTAMGSGIFPCKWQPDDTPLKGFLHGFNTYGARYFEFYPSDVKAFPEQFIEMQRYLKP